jgi:hypothetical protein
MTPRIVTRGAPACSCRSLALLRRRQIDSGATRLRKAYRNRLLGGPGAVLALAHVLDLFADELTGLGGRRLPGALVAPCPLERSFLRH